MFNLSQSQVRAGLFALEKGKNPTAPYPSPDPSVDYGFAVFHLDKQAFEWFSMNATADPENRGAAFAYVKNAREKLDWDFEMSNANRNLATGQLVLPSNHVMTTMPVFDFALGDTLGPNKRTYERGPIKDYGLCYGLGFYQFECIEYNISNRAAKYIRSGHQVLGAETMEQFPGSDLVASVERVRSNILGREYVSEWAAAMKSRCAGRNTEQGRAYAPALEVA